MSFLKMFGSYPQVKIIVNGRVNLLGEHTDYNHGLVLPIQLPCTTMVSISCADIQTSSTSPTTLSIYSMNEEEDGIITRTVSDTPKKHWSDYITGALLEFQNSIHAYHPSYRVPDMQIAIESTIPVGVGLSSSAALEIGVLKAVRELYVKGILSLPQEHTVLAEWSDLHLAKMGQRAENNYVGLPCGLMDQLVISMGDIHKALKIDFFDLDEPTCTYVDICDGVTFLIIASGVTHTLTDSGDEGYKTRYEQCYQAADILKIPHLSVLNPEDLEDIRARNVLDSVLLKRVTHIVSENQRVRMGYEALQRHDSATFARCMIESHCSQRDLYNVSVPEIDALVDTAMEEGALGARLTGGGFGGSVVVMVDEHRAEDVGHAILSRHPRAMLVCDTRTH